MTSNMIERATMELVKLEDDVSQYEFLNSFRPPGNAELCDAYDGLIRARIELLQEINKIVPLSEADHDMIKLCIRRMQLASRETILRLTRLLTASEDAA
ncbi:MAG: hypothetical protein KF889_04800 [Alphaproteobacteria bacterium]|nr:hypothetical protein [Alphaproteobacteria bacterium]MCW5742186.1 hypothetical protein [Alphaproteobacteria bacterium]